MTPESLEQTVSLSQYPSDELASVLWEAGVLDYKLRAYQRAVYREVKLALWGSEPDAYRKPRGKHRRGCLEIHRRFGKSHVIGIIACELCRQKPGARVYWAAETQKQVTRFLVPLLNRILQDCPRHMRPHWSRADGEWRWPNGSVILLSGCEDEGKCDRLRGDGCDLFVVDEAGSIQLLDYLYRSVVLWMLSTTNGPVLMPSTPARSPGHPFTTFCAMAEGGDGWHAHRDVYSSGFSAEKIAELARECGGEDTPAWQREGLALRVIDQERAIIGDFSLPGVEEAIVKPWCKACGLHYDQHVANDNGDPRIRAANDNALTSCSFVWSVETPEHFDCYVGIDWGHKPDFTAMVFGHYDFEHALPVVTHERELSGPSTVDIATAIREGEIEAWGEHWLRTPMTEGEERPYKRVSDVDPQILYDLARLHSIQVSPSRRDDKEAQINDLRVRVRRTGIRIHPRCRKLRAHLKAGIWNKKRTSYERLPGFGHFDFVDALIYWHRNIDPYHSPFPLAVETNPWRKRAQPMHVVPEHMRPMQNVFSAQNRALFPSKRRS